MLAHLTDEICRKAKADAGKVTWYRDLTVRGLALRVTPARAKNPRGGKFWTFRFYPAGVERRCSLGRYPAVTLAEARAKAEALKAESDPTPGPTKQGREGLNTLSAILHERREAWPDNWAEAKQRLFEAVEETRNSGRPKALLKALGLLRGRGKPGGSTRLGPLAKAVVLQVSSEFHIGGTPSMSPEKIVEDAEYRQAGHLGDPKELEREIEKYLPEISRVLADDLAKTFADEAPRRREASRTAAAARKEQVFNDLVGSPAMEEAILHVQASLNCDRETARQKIREKFIR